MLQFVLSLVKKKAHCPGTFVYVVVFAVFFSIRDNIRVRISVTTTTAETTYIAFYTRGITSEEKITFYIFGMNYAMSEFHVDFKKLPSSSRRLPCALKGRFLIFEKRVSK